MGTAPSTRAIQRELGGGSVAIAEYLRAWWKRRNDTETTFELPEEFKALYGRSMLEAYGKARKACSLLQQCQRQSKQFSPQLSHSPLP